MEKLKVLNDLRKSLEERKFLLLTKIIYDNSEILELENEYQSIVNRLREVIKEIYQIIEKL